MLILRKTLKYLMLGVFTLFLVAACSDTNNNFVNREEAIASSARKFVSDCQTVRHDLGETEVCGKPQKVVALSVHTLDLLLSLDKQPAGYAAPLNVYRGEVFDNPTQQIPYLGDRITSKPVNLGQDNEPSLEKLAVLKPDLIIGEAGNNAEIYSLLSKIAPTLLFDNRTAMEKWQQSIQKIAKALGNKQRAEKEIATYEKLVADARADLYPVITNNPKLLLLGTNRLSENIMALERDTYLGELMEEIGFQLVNENQIERAISVKALPQFNEADIIMVLGYDLSISDRQQLSENQDSEEIVEKQQVKTAKQSWQENAIAQSMKASQEERVYFVTYYLWNGLNRPTGTELILEQLRQILLNPK